MGTLTIIGRRWFCTNGGNTYFSAVALLDGVEVSSIDFEYGYDDQYKHAMLDKLQHEELIPPREKYANGGTEGSYQWADREGITLSCHVSDVARKKDL